MAGYGILSFANLRRCGGMVDTGDLKSPGSNTVPVRVRSPAPIRLSAYRGVEQLVARRAHNPEVGGSSPPSATRRMYDHAAAWSYIFYAAMRLHQVAHTKSSGPPQPTMRTEKDIGAKNPETWAVSGFRFAIFQSEIQKLSFPQNDLWGGLELNPLAFRGRFCDCFRRVCPFFRFFNC